MNIPHFTRSRFSAFRNPHFTGALDKTSSSPFANSCDSCSVSVGVGTPLIARLPVPVKVSLNEETIFCPAVMRTDETISCD